MRSWFGGLLWRSACRVRTESPRQLDDSLTESFGSGLLITLADLKAMAFYLGLFPLVGDRLKGGLSGAIVISILVVVAVGGAKLSYAAVAIGGVLLFRNDRLIRLIHRSAALGLLVVGICRLSDATSAS